MPYQVQISRGSSISPINSEIKPFKATAPALQILLRDRDEPAVVIRTVITSAQTTEVIGDGTRVTSLTYTDRQSGAARTLELAGVFV
jgi:alkyl hydroperoxide reductase subunit F